VTTVCDHSDQNLGFEAQGPPMFEHHNSDDIMGTFTWTCDRTYNFSHLSRTIIRYSINVVRCAVKKGPLSITPFLRIINVCMHTYLYRQTDTYTHLYTHTYIYTYIYIYIYLIYLYVYT